MSRKQAHLAYSGLVSIGQSVHIFVYDPTVTFARMLSCLFLPKVKSRGAMISEDLGSEDLRGVDWGAKADRTPAASLKAVLDAVQEIIAVLTRRVSPIRSNPTFLARLDISALEAMRYVPSEVRRIGFGPCRTFASLQLGKNRSQNC